MGFYMKTVLSFFVTFLVAGNSFAQTSFELSCRSKAKEIAIQTYSSCVTEAKQERVSKIRTSYQKDLANIKSKYDKELKQLNGPATQSKAPASAAVPMKGAAKTLPTKKTSDDIATPEQSVSDATKVITVESGDSDEQIEFVEMPTE